MGAPTQVDLFMRPLTWVHTTTRQRLTACVEALCAARVITEDERRDMLDRLDRQVTAQQEGGR